MIFENIRLLICQCTHQKYWATFMHFVVQMGLPTSKPLPVVIHECHLAVKAFCSKQTSSVIHTLRKNGISDVPISEQFNIGCLLDDFILIYHLC